MTKIQQKVYRDTTFGGCGRVFSRDILPVLVCKRKEERGKGVERYKGRLKQKHTCVKGIIAHY